MASTTDVRAWLREQGHEIGDRGAIAQHLRDEYEAAHAAPPNTVQGELLDSSYPYPDAAMGVTEADFPPDDDFTAAADGAAAADEPAATVTTGTGRRGRRGAERRPRQVKPAPGGGIRERIFGSPGKGGSQGKAKRSSGPRVSLSDWAEETWSDLAWLAQPVPPLAKILELQAPYAGVVFDDQVKGTPLDPVLQKAAKYSGVMRALNGLAGPPVYVGMICATGQRVQVGVDAAGDPVLDFDGRTKMLFQGLRYSLLQMTKIAEVKAEEIQQRTQASVERTRAVDAMIDSIFGFTDDGPGRPAEPAYAPGPPPQANGYAYPPAPAMDATGADPGRL